MKDFSCIINRIRGAERLVLLPHVHGDGDALGSCAALCLYLTSLGKKAIIVTEEPVERKLSYLKDIPGLNFTEARELNGEALFEGSPYIALAIDVSDRKRLGSREHIFYGAAETVQIDHHEPGEPFSDVAVINPVWAATAEGICELLEQAGYDTEKNVTDEETELAKNIAVCIYTALVTDTGCFAYSNVTEETHGWGGKCVSLAGDLSWIYRRVYETKTKACVALKKIAYGKIFYPYDYIACLEITDEDMKAAGADDEECGGLAAELRAIEGIYAAVFIRPGTVPGQKRISLRSDDKCNVSKVAGRFGGGGHARASGITQIFDDGESYGTFLKELFESIREETEGNPVEQ